MRIALCTDWTREAVLTARIKNGLITHSVMVDFFENPLGLSEALGITAYDAVVVAQSGAKGMESVILIRARCPTAEIVWLTNDDQFGKIAYDMRVAMLLGLDCTAAELAGGLTTAIERGNRHENCFVRGQPGNRADRRIVGAG